jgi:transcriptional regulator with XRE-family HTH domain
MSKKPNLTSAQIRAARALLNWSARRLSDESGVSPSTIHRAESARAYPSTHEQRLAAIKRALESSGVDFLDSSGVRLRAFDGDEDNCICGEVANDVGRERPPWLANS